MDQPPEKKGINLSDILLPKKEERTSASASRVNAGVLLEGEQKAELPKQERPAPIAQPPKPAGPVNTSNIAPLETYQSDMETVISEKNVSAVTIAAAEAKRSSRLASLSPAAPKPARDLSGLIKFGIIGLCVLLVGGAMAVLGYVLLRPAPSVTVAGQASAPFIAVDSTQALVVTPEQFNRETLMQNLESIKEKTALSVGLVSRVYVAEATTSAQSGEAPVPITAQALLSTIAPNITDNLLRTLDPDYYLLGVHVFDDNQAFLILKVDSYEQAFSGMLAWERTMPQELSPLFTRTPPGHIQSENPAASTTEAAALIPTDFRDKIVDNHDARVIEDDAGDVLLLWTFLDRSTLVITTNENTLAEIISRRGAFTSPQ